MKPFRVPGPLFAIAALALMAAAGVAYAADPAAPADNDLWQKGSNWMSLRAGNVRDTQKDAPPGNLSVGLTFVRFISPRFGVGATIERNLVEKRGDAALIEIPVTLDYNVYFHWKTGVSPMLGVGFGGWYRQMYRTGDDQSEFQPGGFIKAGLNAPVNQNTLVGLEYKLSSVSSDFEGSNPAFGDNPPSTGRTSFQLTVTRAYW